MGVHVNGRGRHGLPGDPLHLLDPGIVLRHGVGVLGPWVKVDEDDQPSWEAVRGVRTVLRGTNSWDILNRTGVRNPHDPE